jgi:dipeptidyl-peptidase-3
MKKQLILYAIIMVGLSFFSSCNGPSVKNNGSEEQPDTFQYFTEKFGDTKILRYRVPEFENLSLKQKELLYYLSQAALAGRDIIWDQNGKYNLEIRKILENIIETYKGDRNSEDFQKFMVYAKRVLFSNGIYHHYSTDKILPEFSKEYFDELIKNSNQSTFVIPAGKKLDKFIAEIKPVIFDPKVMPKRVWLDPAEDLVLNSACNFYDGVNEKEAENYYKKMKNPDDTMSVEFGLNSKLI